MFHSFIINLHSVILKLTNGFNLAIVDEILGQTTFSVISLSQFLLNDKKWSSTAMVWKDVLFE